jgi:hypothetical protein
MKLQDAEKKRVEKAADKVDAFRDVIAERLRNYLEENNLRGYENRKDGNADVKKILPLLHFLKARYPVSTGYLSKEFWQKKSPPKTFESAFIHQELVNISDDKLQPIWRVGEILEFHEKDTSLFVELYPYSNHYLDSSLRIYEVYPQANHSVVIVTDVMEVDELTKSGVVRLLYKGKMQSAVLHVQNEALDALSS